jgi:XTP/dITP diphosphohydrolase
MKVLLLATGNAKKGKELAELASGRFEVKTLKDVGLDALEIVEDADTFAGNARKKVDAVSAELTPAQRAELHALLADDSGIVVDAIDGKPGVRSARFAADHGTGDGDAANNALLLTLLEAVPHERRTARFASHVHALVLASGAREDAFGTVEGHIARELKGEGGFGYDPMFLPVEAPGRSMAELSSNEKHAISHRGRAMRVLLDALG